MTRQTRRWIATLLLTDSSRLSARRMQRPAWSGRAPAGTVMRDRPPGHQPDALRDSGCGATFRDRGGAARADVRPAVGPATGRPDAAHHACRVHRAGTPARRWFGAANGARGGPPALDDPVRAARHGQDHAR